MSLSCNRRKNVSIGFSGSNGNHIGRGRKAHTCKIKHAMSMSIVNLYSA